MGELKEKFKQIFFKEQTKREFTETLFSFLTTHDILIEREIPDGLNMGGSIKVKESILKHFDCFETFKYRVLYEDDNLHTVQIEGCKYLSLIFDRDNVQFIEYCEYDTEPYYKNINFEVVIKDKN